MDVRPSLYKLKTNNMLIYLEPEEITDIRRALIITMQQLDLTQHPNDLQLSDRLEKINEKLS